MDTTPISEERLRLAIHELEQPRLVLAMFAIVPLALVVLAVSLGSLLLVPIVLAIVLYFLGRILEARLMGGAVEVSEANFPEVAEDLVFVSERLGYPKPVRAFIVQEGEINAFLWRVFGKKFITFNSTLITSLEPQERRFIVGYFVGALRARHLRFHEAAALIEAVDNLKFLNVLVLPYLRATVYTGDRFGLLAIEEPEAAFRALKKLLIGNELSERVTDHGLAQQGNTLRGSVFRRLSILFSSHPHMTDRFLELQTYAALSRGGAASEQQSHQSTG